MCSAVLCWRVVAEKSVQSLCSTNMLTASVANKSEVYYAKHFGRTGTGGSVVIPLNRLLRLGARPLQTQRANQNSSEERTEVHLGWDLTNRMWVLKGLLCSLGEMIQNGRKMSKEHLRRPEESFDWCRGRKKLFHALHRCVVCWCHTVLQAADLVALQV